MSVTKTCRAEVTLRGYLPDLLFGFHYAIICIFCLMRMMMMYSFFFRVQWNIMNIKQRGLLFMWGVWVVDVRNDAVNIKFKKYFVLFDTNGSVFIMSLYIINWNLIFNNKRYTDYRLYTQARSRNSNPQPSEQKVHCKHR